MKNASSDINGYKMDINCGKFCLRGKNPMSAVNWKRGPTREPLSQQKTFSTEKSQLTPSRLGFHMIFMWLGSDGPNIYPSIHCFGYSRLPWPPQILSSMLGSLGSRVGAAGWAWAAPGSCPLC